jgi:lipopolysaccharide transport system permease protein/teichoic acid transport system permease protein
LSQTVGALNSIRHVLPELVKRDLLSRFSGTVFGLFWTIFQPLAFVVILSIVFRYGLKQTSTPDGVQFVPWFFCGSIAWNLIAEACQQSTTSVRDYAFLVRKVNFSCWLLPLARVISALLIHLIFLAIIVGVLALYGYYPRLSWLELPLIMGLAILFLTGLGLITSTLAVFFKDAAAAMGIMIQFGFWLTPVIWPPSALPENLRPWLLINPAYTIVEGYRALLLEGRHVIDLPALGLAYVSILSLLFLVGGFILFNKLRPQFGDVL